MVVTKSKEVTYQPIDDSVIFQGTALGKPFSRYTITLPGGEALMQARQVQIALTRHEATNDLVPDRYQPADHPLKDDYPSISLNQLGLLREQMIRRDSNTVYKHGSSRRYLDIDPNRGKFQIQKPSGSFTLYIGPPDRDHPQISKKFIK